MKLKKITTTFLAVGMVSSSLLLGTASEAVASVSGWQKGVTIQPRNTTDFSSTSFQQSVRDAAAMNANYATLVIPLYQSNLYSTDIQGGWNTPTDQSLIDAVNFIHSLGLKVMFKPHLDSYDGQWRANINPGDRATWYANYSNKINHYASIAQQTGVEQFCVGAELISMATYTSNGANTNAWYGIISGVRKVYSGPLTYSANWGAPGGFADEKNHINFWDALDVVGISAYYELQGNGNNDITGLKASWNNYNTNDITPLYNKWKKPILFTEIGYRSIGGAHYRPWDYSLGGGYDPTEQSSDFTALVQYWDSQPFMIGLHIWEWSSDPNYGGNGNTNYTPQHKPAYDTLAQLFGQGGTPTPIPTTTPPTTVSCGSPASGSFTGCYFSDTNLSNAVLTRNDSSINFDWGSGSPDPKVPIDNFSARWEGSFNFNAGTYNFTMTGDDGIRLFIDNQLVINKWVDQPPTTYTYSQNMTAGTHSIKMEYFENGGGAVAKLSWAQGSTTPPPTTVSCPAAGSGSFTGCYYSGKTFSNLLMSRTDNAINFDWGNGSPGSPVPSDNFSVRWQGNFNFSAGSYTFTATGDDGIRVYVDNNPVIDKWLDQPPTTYTATVNLTAGTHLIKVEYYENGGGAVAKVSWAAGGTTTTPPPSGGGGETTTPPPSGRTTIVYINGYPTVNGNYIDCNGNIDNDAGHHTTNPNDKDPAHHVGQNCPAGSYVATHSP